ncbi:TPA: hypothetical protein DDZ10_03870 [Candidatus Uhrbacteria bacterium]|nr:MAG: hypothetical protein UY79_C0003G0002 [Parcubacteria group bacterium GW2011_GWA2_53_21]HBL39780.1 hypothetical protein [Candidatus Uhrbacteria bacterium]
MLIFYRFIPFLAGLLCAAALGLAIVAPDWFLPAMGALLLALAFLYARLIDLPKHDFGFWNFLLTPLLFTLSAGFFFVFLEDASSMFILLGVLAALHLIYAEHLFYYFHRPSEYRVYTIERVSLVLSIATMFLLSSSLFGLMIFVQVPLWALAPIFFLTAVFTVYAVLWVSKMDPNRGSLYAIVLGLLLTELFLALSFLPVGHTTNAVLMASFLYFFLGVSRADFMGRLTRRVFLRYLFFTIVMVATVLSTTTWV